MSTLNNYYFVCTECHKKYPPNRLSPRCDDCSEPLEVKFVSTEKFIKSKQVFSGNILEHYAHFDNFSKIEPKLSLDNATANPFPPSGNAPLLKILREYQGITTTVSDEEALLGQIMIAKERIIAQPAAVSIAALQKLKEEGLLKKVLTL